MIVGVGEEDGVEAFVSQARVTSLDAGVGGGDGSIELWIRVVIEKDDGVEKRNISPISVDGADVVLPENRVLDLGDSTFDPEPAAMIPIGARVESENTIF